jgi:hypothetical protein
MGQRKGIAVKIAIAVVALAVGIGIVATLITTNSPQPQDCADGQGVTVFGERIDRLARVCGVAPTTIGRLKTIGRLNQ